MTEHETGLLLQIAKDVATNTQSTIGIEKHLSTLNGKVAAHETQLKALDAAATLISTTLANMQKERNEEKKAEADAQDEKKWTKRYFIERGGWAVISIAAIASWKVITYLIDSDIIKRLIK